VADTGSDLLKRLEPVIVQVRQRRQPVERTWLSNHAAWRAIRTRYYYNSDSFKHYIPAARRAIERSVVRMRQMLVPENDFFEVYPGDIFDMASGVAADAVSSYMAYLFEQRIRIKAIVSQLSRCLLLYGRAITKASVELNKWSEDADGEIVHEDIWPTLRVVDPFAFYIFPETVTDISDAQLVFEDSMYPWACYLDAVQASGGLIDTISRADLCKAEWPTHHIERLQLGPGSVASPGDLNSGESDRDKQKASHIGEFVALTEGFLKYQQSWMHFWIVWNLRQGPKIVRLHKVVGDRQPFRMALAREIPGETNTSGMMDDIEPLQVLLNDQFNRMEEAASIAAVPPVRIDPSKVTRADSLVFRPRAKWLVEPDGAKVLEIADTSRGSQASVMATLNLINSVFTPGGIVEGQPPRGSPRAGFAFSSMVNLSMADIKDLADTLEECLLTPSLKDMYTLTIRHVPRDQVLKIPGTAAYNPQQMTVYDLYGGWNFKWVGQLHSQDMQQRGQKMQQFLEGLAPMMEPLMQQGWTIDLGQLVKMIWRDVLGERGFDRILVKQPPAPPPMVSGALQGAPASPGDPMQALAGMLGPGGSQSAPTPENRERQQSRQMSTAAGGPSQ
jgi:hypothetical protein